VTDFCILRLGPLHTGVFNVADVAILLGVAFIVIAAPSRTEASA
jgi:lipoprotein signal peptidase